MIRSFIYLLLFFVSTNVYGQNKHSQIEKKRIAINEKRKASRATVSDIISSLEAPVPPSKIRTPPLLTGSFELGLLYKTGNTRSGDIKTGLDFRFEREIWFSLLNIDYLLKKSDIANESGQDKFTTTDNKWTISSQTNYNLDNKEQNYIYGNLWYEDNEFSSFENQSSISTGWGRHWYKSNKTSLWGDIGPGYKRDLYRATDTSPQIMADTFIVQLQALYITKLGEHIELKEYLSAKQALDTDENSIYKSETIITTKLISTLQVKFTITLGYNTKLEDDQKNLDTQTAVTLVYSF
jgi:putative salt-induced outer membrane protein YdiY